MTSKFESQATPRGSLITPFNYDFFVILFYQIVYGNIITNVWDRVYLTSIVDYILTSATRQSGKIRLGDTMLATPPANVDPSEYPNWLEEKWDNANSAVNVLSLDKEVERFTNKARYAMLTLWLYPQIRLLYGIKSKAAILFAINLHY